MTTRQRLWMAAWLLAALLLYTLCVWVILRDLAFAGDTLSPGGRGQGEGGFFPVAHREAPQCRITGLVYASEDLAEVDAVLDAIPFDCPITAARHERRLVLTSPRWYVEIAIPRAGGWIRIAYTWGRDEAYLGARAVAVEYGPVESAGWRSMQESGG